MRSCEEFPILTGGLHYLKRVMCHVSCGAVFLSLLSKFVKLRVRSCFMDVEENLAEMTLHDDANIVVTSIQYGYEVTLAYRARLTTLLPCSLSLYMIVSSVFSKVSP